jgi:hypothetical protein
MMYHVPNFAVRDLTISDVAGRVYDLAIFASGYEARCTQAVSLLDPKAFRSAIVIGFQKPVLPELRAVNDQVFIERLGQSPTIEGDDLTVNLANQLTALVERAGSESRTVSILVDYSSMRREWYGFVLSFLGHMANPGVTISVDFLYSFGVYPPRYELSIEKAVLESIVPLPGMEGLSASRASSIAVFGLGFSPVAGLGALERLQPDKVFCFLANPGSADANVETTKRCNEPLIKRTSHPLISVPLGNLAAAYRALCELVWPFVGKYHINILPMGPKPHILASMLVAQTYKPVGCLYGKVRHPSGSNIGGNGHFCIGSVIIRSPSRHRLQ